MLWVVFNENGQFIAEYNVGNLPVAGTNEFQIFAYFKNISNAYNGASLKLYKPDLNNDSYVPLLMSHASLKYEGTTNDDLTNNQTYPGFLFDFSKVGVRSLLDTAGVWRAVITLYAAYSSDVRNVVGTVTFEVGNGIDSSHGTEIPDEEVITEIYAALASKLDVNSKGYIHIADTLPTGDDLDNIENGTLYLVDRTLYKYNSSSSTFSIFYQLNAITITGTSGSLLDYASIITSNSNVILARYVQGSSQSNPSRYEFYTLKGYNTITGERTFERLDLTQGTNDFTFTKQVITVSSGFAWSLSTTTNTTLNKDYVNNQLGLKADKTYVDTELDKKANTIYVDTELDKKADTIYVDTNFGHSLSFNIDSSTYVLTINLIDKENNVLSSQSIDLPLESIITDVEYYATYEYQGTTYEKVIVIELSTTSEPTIVPVGDLVSGLVSQTNNPNQVYVTNSSGNQSTVTYGQQGANAIVQRDSNGFIKQTNTPVNDNDVPNKQYVDAVGTILNNTKLDKVSTPNVVYGTDNSGNQTTYEFMNTTTDIDYVMGD